MGQCCRAGAVSRRRLMSGLTLGTLGLVMPAGIGRATAPAGEQLTAEAARRRLVAGNERFAAGQHLRLDHGPRRETVAKGQLPFAIVLGCSDSRVPPEVLFDQGLGDIFVVRVAGNIADDLAMGSMEYAVDHFATPLIIVLGHERCGAVSATVDAVASGATPPPHIASLVTAIRPAVEATRNAPGDPVENAVAAHVRATVAALQSADPVLAPAVKAGRVEIVGAEYHLGTGKVTFYA